tara:strand:- start:135 stop:2369 length:2235 start_codon:yes stop_codon:yes gene_type:complete
MNKIFGTNDNFDEYILNKLSNDGTKYLLTCYENLKKSNSEISWNYFNNYYNMFLSNDFWNKDYKLLFNIIITDIKLFNLTIKTDNLLDTIYELYKVNLNNFDNLFNLSKIIFKNEFIVENIIYHENWLFDSGLKNELSFLGILFNSINNDENWEQNIIKIHKLILILLKNNNIKKNIVKWFTNILNQNLKRKMIGSENETYLDCSNYNFLINITSVFYIFWNKSKNKNIDFNYLKNNDSELNWLINKSDEQNKYSFLNDCFFICFLGFDISLISLININNKLKEDIERYEELLNFNENSNDILKQMYDNKLKQLIKLKIDKLENNNKLLNNNKFINYYSNFLNDISIENKINIDEIYYSIIEGHNFFLNKNINNFNIKLIITSIKIINGDFTKNPHIRCDYLNFIANLMSKKILIQYLNDEYIKKNLFSSCIKLYTEIEKFNEKFTPRINIGYLIQYISSINTEYYNILQSLIKNELLFKKFINMILNDLTHMLNEGLIKMSEISKNKELEIESRELEYIKGSFYFAYDMLDLVIFLSKKFKDIFLTTELKYRFIEMLNNYLNKLVSKKSKELIVDNPQKYGFNPVLILEKISKIYSKYYNIKEFIEIVSNDIDNYNSKLMNKMIQILLKNDKLKWEISGRLYHLMNLIENNKKKEVIEYEDVPDEFLDPIIMTIINNPIMVPDMDLIVEESVIKRHLLTSETNPFNRKKLTLLQLDEYNKHDFVLNKIKKFNQKLNYWKSKYV